MLEKKQISRSAPGAWRTMHLHPLVASRRYTVLVVYYDEKRSEVHDYTNRGAPVEAAKEAGWEAISCTGHPRASLLLSRLLRATCSSHLSTHVLATLYLAAITPSPNLYVSLNNSKHTGSLRNGKVTRRWPSKRKCKSRFRLFTRVSDALNGGGGSHILCLQTDY